ncbi:hypothetical protein ASJ81_14705 [Methanosarcina spelaei]|uniref:Type I-B CRISPR-associated protein Cas5 n=1 Tax=Methanosarcina spelaei TaxID=1036679 RepID=A0A2A2HXZ7_9EURY|nr:CRISPR-associated protein Cas5 [Methanosarcina spelaei]PAV14228.1 hypothetical protein ASJ81_14705 [Methanosarcina spelaei]
MKVISFLMKGRFAHFCLPFTNVYRLTQPCPTKTAIMGFIGSVMGINKNDFILYDKLKCGIEIVDEVEGIKKNYRTINVPYLGRKGFAGNSANNQSSRISIEVIVDPIYKIYLLGDEKFLSEIQKLMLLREPVYTPYLGLAQFIASTEFHVSEIVDAQAVEGENVNASGAFIRKFHGDLDFSKLTYGSIRLTEFEGIKGISPPRNFEHSVFAINLDSAPIPLKEVKQVVRIPEWDKYVPFF